MSDEDVERPIVVEPTDILHDNERVAPESEVGSRPESLLSVVGPGVEWFEHLVEPAHASAFADGGGLVAALYGRGRCPGLGP